MDQHRCPEDAPSSWKGKAGRFVNDAAVGRSHQMRSQLTSKTPSPLPRCSRGSQEIVDRPWGKLKGATFRFYSVNVKHSVLRGISQPAEGLGGGSVVQGSTADLVRLIDLSASAHQGHSALIPPVSSRIVQWCPAPTSKATRVTGNMNLTLDNQKQISSRGRMDTHLPIMSLLFRSVPLLKSKFRHSTFLPKEMSTEIKR